MQRRPLVSRMSVRGLDPEAALMALKSSIHQTKSIQESPSSSSTTTDATTAAPPSSASLQQQSSLSPPLPQQQQQLQQPGTPNIPPSTNPKAPIVIHAHDDTSSVFRSKRVGRPSTRESGSPPGLRTPGLSVQCLESSDDDFVLIDNKSLHDNNNNHNNNNNNRDDEEEDYNHHPHHHTESLSPVNQDSTHNKYRHRIISPSHQQLKQQGLQQNQTTTTSEIDYPSPKSPSKPIPQLQTNLCSISEPEPLATPTGMAVEVGGGSKFAFFGSPSPPSPTSSTNSLRQRRLQMMENKNRFRGVGTPTAGTTPITLTTATPTMNFNEEDNNINCANKPSHTINVAGSISSSTGGSPPLCPAISPLIHGSAQTIDVNLMKLSESQQSTLSSSSSSTLTPQKPSHQQSDNSRTAFELLQQQFQSRHKFLDTPSTPTVSALDTSRALSNNDFQLVRHSGLGMNKTSDNNSLNYEDEFEDDDCCLVSPRRQTPTAGNTLLLLPSATTSPENDEHVLKSLKNCEEVPPETWLNTDRNKGLTHIPSQLQHIAYLKKSYGINKIHVCQCDIPQPETIQPNQGSTTPSSIPPSHSTEIVTIIDRFSNPHSITIDTHKRQEYCQLQHQSFSEWPRCQCSLLINPTTRLSIQQINQLLLTELPTHGKLPMEQQTLLSLSQEIQEEKNTEPPQNKKVIFSCNDDDFDPDAEVMVKSTPVHPPKEKDVLNSHQDSLLRHYSTYNIDFVGTKQDNCLIKRDEYTILCIYPDDDSDLDLPSTDVENDEEDCEIKKNKQNHGEDDTMAKTTINESESILETNKPIFHLQPYQPTLKYHDATQLLTKSPQKRSNHHNAKKKTIQWNPQISTQLLLPRNLLSFPRFNTHIPPLDPQIISPPPAICPTRLIYESLARDSDLVREIGSNKAIFKP